MFTIRVVHTFENNADDEFKRKVLEQLNLINSKISTMTPELQRLTNEVTEVKTVNQSAITLLQSLSTLIRESIDNKAALNALADSLDTDTNELAAAVTANTPSENEPPVNPT